MTRDMTPVTSKHISNGRRHKSGVSRLVTSNCLWSFAPKLKRDVSVAKVFAMTSVSTSADTDVQLIDSKLQQNFNKEPCGLLTSISRLI